VVTLVYLVIAVTTGKMEQVATQEFLGIVDIMVKMAHLVILVYLGIAEYQDIVVAVFLATRAYRDIQE